jgi:hypothetical protein
MKTKNTFKILPVMVLLVFGILSCNRIRGPRTERRIEDRRTLAETHYDVMGFPGDHDVITSDVTSVDDSLEAESDVIALPEYSAGESQIREIFAVQVFASKSLEEAEEFESSVTPLFNEEVHTDYKQPYYKVRIGRCTNLEEAEILLRKVKNMGFPKAWLVRIRL